MTENRADGREFFPDSKEGAIALAMKFTAINSDTKWWAIMDPDVKGCWLVMGWSEVKGPMAFIVYLEHHPSGPDMEDVDVDEVIQKYKTSPTVQDWSARF